MVRAGIGDTDRGVRARDGGSKGSTCPSLRDHRRLSENREHLR